MNKLNIIDVNVDEDESTVDKIVRFSESDNQASPNIMVVYGQAGTGKTETLKRVAERLKHRFNIAAPTGVAASRIKQMNINSSLAGEPKTIHRLLEYTIGKKDEYGEYITGKEPGPTRNKYNPLKNRITLIDEASMLGNSLYNKLLNAMPHSYKIVFFGDIRQLPPVEGESILLELLQSFNIPKIELTKNYRQENGSKIIDNALAINKGEMPKGNKKDFVIVKDLPCEYNPKLFFEDISTYVNVKNYIKSNYQVICPTNAYCFILNKFFQERFSEDNPNKKYINYIFFDKSKKIDKEFKLYEGDKIIFTENDYNLGFNNGDTGYVEKIDPFGIIYFKLEESDKIIKYPIPKIKPGKNYPRLKILLGYVVTTHKTQSKEYEEVLGIYQNEIGKAGNRKNLYTAITRAKKKFILMGSEYILTKMIENEGS